MRAWECSDIATNSTFGALSTMLGEKPVLVPFGSQTLQWNESPC